MPNTYDIGDEVTLTGTFTTSAGDPIDPTNITCGVRDPNGDETNYDYPATVTKVSTGVFSITILPTLTGVHWYRWAGTGAAVSAEEQNFYVRRRYVGAS